MTSTELPLCTFQSDALALEHLLVASWQGEDLLSRPYRFEVVLASLAPLLNEDAMLGVPAHLTLFDTLGAAHPYHGIVTSVEVLDADELYHYCRVVLEPRMSRLRLQRFSEIWLDKNLPELVRDILKHADLTHEGQGSDSTSTQVFDFDLRLRDDDIPHTQASFTCQYEESSFDFLSRLLEYSGCYYFFEQQAEQEALIICSDRSAQPRSMLPVRYRPLDTALNNDLQAVAHSFIRRTVVQPAHVVLQDFSASNAQRSLHSTAPVAAGCVAGNDQAPGPSPAFSGEYGVYGEHFGSNDQGLWLAQRRAQALGCRHRLFQGSGHVVGLRSGRCMALTGHTHPGMNAVYQVLEVHHSGHQPLPATSDDKAPRDTLVRFVVIPAEVQFRPRLDTQKPNVVGVLSAVVDGDDCGKPLLNQHGCYKVRFPFIRHQKPGTRGSAWLRMASMSAGSSHGMHFPLLKGSEVLVSFLGGDPDRPIIVGSVPNSENPNRVNEKNATQSGLSTAGGHFLAIDDQPGAAHMQMGAPGGSTTLTLGNGEIAGAQLRTNAHLHLTSSSLHHEVPGVYSMSMGTGEPPPASGSGPEPDAAEPAQPPEPKKPLGNLNTGSHWGGPSWLNLGAKADYSNAPTFSAALKTATVQSDASFGALKLSLTGQATSVAMNTSGVSASMSFNGIDYTYSTTKKDCSKVSDQSVLITRLQSSVTQLRGDLRDVEVKTYNMAANESITLVCGDNSIEMNALGVRIVAGHILTLKGDTVIEGNAFVNGNLTVHGKTTTETATVSRTLSVDTASVNTLNADAATFSTPYIPPVPLEVQARAAEKQAEFDALSQTVKGLTESLNMVANLALEPVEKFSPLDLPV
ncbi:type VI secretion system Vgr family protein [Pseudomonas sp. E2-15]